MAAPRLMVIVFAAAGLAVAAIVLLATQSWWALGVALVIHAVATTAVVAYSLRRAEQDEGKPDPVTEARVEEEQAEAHHR